ncbi:predicted nucleic acid-binding protein, containing PIN domain [Thermococcus kodakarensis KOD1]|uniref:Predicted nucleic acid-binding protein, containing PIN domain n=1 Tax=Thermococcus kodakarensis (strain ATCC BAA-918 / JCM 12380 / KOD1) TaxID=69014 RepID=Q5JIF0_THEKO|nr:type II toxin-antitoxin system VapC family toxin [Thermococcus kodakarensis]WCN28970.1 type II toxin-antitoxin system VapC family toxin [Thermococcus kodakarensis]WCN31276.1 type II toxin-antitoxin system VapC family toxin [Thermococcus kodakarensis]BAD85187.1 predicted nucleic acid-binding protein, containing PIN domain [Thermococcus kodakarensis KOD1]
MRLLIDTNLFVYLNANIDDELAERLDRFYAELVRENEAYTNVLVLDELIHVSKRKYGVSYPETISFIEDVVLPAVRVLPITFEDYLTAKEIILKYHLRPSDALHAATIQNNGLQAIVSEDEDFDKLPIKRLWLEV